MKVVIDNNIWIKILFYILFDVDNIQVDNQPYSI